MQAQAPAAVDPAQLALIQKTMQLETRVRNGIAWFYWIAALSLVNSGAYLLGASFTFVIGLGITQIVDGIVTGLLKELGPGWELLRVLGLTVNVIIAGMFVLMGVFGSKRIRWPVIVGMVLYALDGIILLLFQDWMGVIFHGIALYGLWTGLNAIGQLDAVEKAMPPASAESLRQQVAAYMQVTPEAVRRRWILIGLIALAVLVLVVTIILQS